MNFQGAKSITTFEILPEPPAKRSAENPWPQFPRVFKVDYGHEEVKIKWGKDPRQFSTTSKVPTFETKLAISIAATKTLISPICAAGVLKRRQRECEWCKNSGSRMDQRWQRPVENDRKTQFWEGKCALPFLRHWSTIPCEEYGLHGTVTPLDWR